VKQRRRIVGPDYVVGLGRLRKLLELALRVLEPFLVRVLVSERALDLVVADDAAAYEAMITWSSSVTM
jgi:hypothetical protein